MNKYEVVRVDDENPQYCSLPIESKEDLARVYNAAENPTGKVSDFINDVIEFDHVIMQASEYEGEDGETIKGVRTVFFCTDGSTLVANSTGIAKSLYTLFGMFGTPEMWDEPMKCKIKQIETKGGNRFFRLEVVV